MSEPPIERQPRTLLPEHAAFFNEEYLERRRQAMARYSGWVGHDALDPKAPAGHAEGVRTSTRLTRQYRQSQRTQAMDISPQDVIDVLVAAGVKNWVLMGLHGYVGYLPDPRATQDVDIMVPYGQRRRAEAAIRTAWPDLIVRELSQVIRFMDPNDFYSDGNAKPVIDLMLPLGKFQESILNDFVILDAQTQHRIPTLEAALAAEYAAMVSSHREYDKKELDSSDFRRMVRANKDRIKLDDLRRLAGEIWEGGQIEIERFVEIALSDRPFPI